MYRPINIYHAVNQVAISSWNISDAHILASWVLDILVIVMSTHGYYNSGWMESIEVVWKAFVIDAARSMCGLHARDSIHDVTRC